MDDDENDGVDEDEEGRGRGLALHRMRMYDCLWLLDIWMVVGRKRCFFFFCAGLFFFVSILFVLFRHFHEKI